jgi:flagellar hook protein FlgE
MEVFNMGLRLLNSGVSGMQANQTALDVVSNNIANDGTTAFKSGRTRFQDMLSQTTTDAGMPTVALGGTNPSQIGLGVKVAGVDTIMTQGNLQTTNRTLDVAIDGDGYFLVSKGPTVFGNNGVTVNSTTNHNIAANANSQISYTRDGAFALDKSGNLLTSDGYRIMGYSVGGSITNDAQGTINFVDASGTVTSDDTNLKTLRIPSTVNDAGTEVRVTSYSIGKDGLIVGTLEDGRVTAIGQIAMASFQNPAGLVKEGGNLYNISANSGDAVVRTGAGHAAASDNSDGYGAMTSGMLEMSNIDLAQQFTDMIVASRAFQANSKAVTTGDDILNTIVNLKR